MYTHDFKELLCRAEKFITRLEEDFFAETLDLNTEYCVSREVIPFSEKPAGDYRPIHVGERWGEAWDQAWFRLHAALPEHWRGRELAVKLYLAGEILLYDRNGRELCGLTNNSVFVAKFRKELYRLRQFGADVELWAQVSGTYIMGLSTEKFDATIQSLTIGIFREDVWQFRNDLMVLLSLVKALEPRHFPAQRILRKINDAINAYLGNPDNAARCSEMLAPLFDSPNQHLTAWALGHSHLDTAWLWPLRESRQKAARTFSSQLDLLERYPDYIFGASTPLHYQFVKEDHPGLYARIKEMVEQGRWELLGGMWIEADTNLSGGESLIRQFLYGKNFFMDEFGIEVKNLWLPDVFGYSAALPQIVRKCGCDYFLTTKLAWNKVSRFPHNIFKWRGIDGSEVLSYIPQESGYGDWMTPETLIRAEELLPENDIAEDMLILYGIGDGGGGPHDEFVERARRMKSLPETPRVKFATAADFFETLEPLRNHLATWEGELYLENHRGTFTSQAWLKKANRELETKLRAVEMIYAAAPMEHYPSDELDRLWKILLLNQFHDILPGSSIREVYEEAKAQFDDAFASVVNLIDQAAGMLLKPDTASCVYFNMLDTPYERPLKLPDGWTGAALNGVELPVQDRMVMVQLPPFGCIELKKVEGKSSAEKNTTLILENELVRYEFDETGRIISAFDRENNCAILTGPGNEFALYEDMPSVYDAWNIEEYYRDVKISGARPAGKSYVENGPLGQVLVLELSIGSSRISQRVSLGCNSRQLEFDTGIEWHESHKMLRVSFPCALKNAEGVCDIQYGFVRRPLNANTAFEAARFEYVMHRYADISNRDYGVAVLNGAKYGCTLRGDIIDMALLRAPKYPDETADLGAHRFRYILYPHAGSMIDAGVIDAAAQLNSPPVVFTGHGGQFELPFKLSGDSVSLTVVKKAEKSDALILRLAEKYGRSGSIELTFPRCAELAECDMLEWNVTVAYGSAEKFTLSFEPFEIKTLKVMTYLLD